MFNWSFFSSISGARIKSLSLSAHLCVIPVPSPSARSGSPPVFFWPCLPPICECPGLPSPSLWFLQSRCFSCLLSLSVKCATRLPPTPPPPVCLALAVPRLRASCLPPRLSLVTAQSLLPISLPTRHRISN